MLIKIWSQDLEDVVRVEAGLGVEQEQHEMRSPTWHNNVSLSAIVTVWVEVGVA
jgi:hypothetical protein